MSDLYSRVQAAVGAIRERTRVAPRVGIVLGSGLGGFASRVEDAVAIDSAEIPNFPQSTVEGHAGRLLLGTVGGVPVAVLQGRVHAYEGYAMEQVTFATRVLGLLGVRTLIVTNAAGGIRADLAPGSLVAIGDHINMTGTNAAAGPNEQRFACAPGAEQRFFDMTAAYSPALRRLALDEAQRQGIAMSEGVYLAVLGPSFETPAEIRAFRGMGADLVGMSTVQEVIVARQMGIAVLGISLVTNRAAGVIAFGEQKAEAIHHEGVLEIGRRAEAQLTSLLVALIPQLNEALVSCVGND
jgi:purine-nucleoside phosphorylase